jgi:hypothetical protein
MKSSLLGKWNLVSFQLTCLGIKWNWGKNATGWIIYDQDQQVSVEIKAEKSIFPSIAGLLFHHRLVYGGRYEIQDDRVIHQLAYSSQKSWLGKDQIRKIIALNAHRFVLQGGGRLFYYQLAWRKS